MTENRINYVGLTLGKRGSGKTTLIKQLIDEYQKQHPHKKVLITDTLDHPAYRHVPAIKTDMIERWKGKGIYRVWDSDTDKMMGAIDKSLSGALVVFEDASKYIRGQLTPEVRRFILDSKQKDLDLIFMFHGFGYVPPEMWRVIDFVTIMRTDNPATRKDYIMNYEAVSAAWQEVQAEKEGWPHRTVMIY